MSLGMRESFEEWYVLNRACSWSTFKRNGYGYADGIVQACWESYQEGYAESARKLFEPDLLNRSGNVASKER